MERILCLDRLKINPNGADAEREYSHWKTMFENFIEECLVGTPKKLRCLVKYVSTTIYELLSDCTNLLLIPWISISLKKYNVRAPSSSYVTTKWRQKTRMSFYRSKLSKNCQFVNVTAKQYRPEFVRDAFINELSNMIRLCLQEMPVV